MGGVIAPNYRMVKNLSLAKIVAYSKPDIKSYLDGKLEITYKDGSIIRGYTDDKPESMEGEMWAWGWIDEIFQCKEQTFLEALARVSDSEGYLWCTGSLGVQYVVPRHHWVWKYFKDPDTMLADLKVFEWDTRDNPHFPQDELKRLKATLDPKTFRQMFELSWDGSSQYAVYDQLDDLNLKSHTYDADLETSVSIDWGWTNEMAVGFFQYNSKTNEIFLFDEIVQSKLKLDQMWGLIRDRGYNINRWYCDTAGKQTREQSGISNIQYFKDNYSISFEHRQTAISYGIPLVRSFIRNTLGQAKLFVDPKCRKSWDQLKNYRYAEKNGIMQEEPVKENDHCPDMIRYYIVNRHDFTRQGPQMESMGRWGDSWLS